MTINYTIKTIFATFLLIYTKSSFAQNKILIDHKTQRFIDNVSELDRTKYIHAYLTIRGEDPKFTSLKSEYNFHPNYIGGRSLTNPASKVKSNTMPTVSNKFSGVRNVDQWYVTGGRPSDLFWDNSVDYTTIDITDYSKDLASYVAKSLKSEWENIGKYFEPMNEPMVHAKDFYPGSNAEKSNMIITEICNYHKYVGEAIHNTPELSNIEVTGYASAYPEFESGNFQLWNNRYKKFIDIAGEEMDVFSIHLYDGKGLNNSGGRRSGSNSEAILDIIEAYSFKKLGIVKPIAVTEYGRLVPNQPGWVANAGISNYAPETNAQAVRSQLHLVMNFMERQSSFEMAIPFNTNRGDDVTYQYAKASLWTRDSKNNIVLSERRYFYEMMKDLKGDRVRINSENIDIQSQAFVSENKLFVMLNNLGDNTQELTLDLIDDEGLQNVDIKKLQVPVDQTPILTTSSVEAAPEKITLVYGETAVITYNFKAPIAFKNKITSKKHYTTEYLKEITSNSSNSFSFGAIDIGEGTGTATLRLGVGREHGRSLEPEILVNGTKITLPSDIIRGPEQPNRSQFFGLLEIPLPINTLNGESDNVVEISFPDTGGKISSVILQVETSEKPIEILPLPETPVTDGEGLGVNTFQNINITPNPVKSGQTVVLTSKNKPMNFSVSTISGSLIFSDQGSRINTVGLEPGIYLINVVQNNSTNTAKLIVE
ncbi:T9SS type A sorting domain-containing protein [Reichenbachiella versicolor]|uniref:T9SS type A sorting domain-containing protein n=1 Tax=Reichenbachiella versicolor TaxID=1821036 RepID=UPI000D6EA0E7|nr:T9SS type A sorting domain-containing protein [Reichenbachiella versicolor]